MCPTLQEAAFRPKKEKGQPRLGVGALGDTRVHIISLAEARPWLPGARVA